MLRVQENLYPVVLEDWLRIVPRRQIFFSRFEDYAKNRTKVLGDVFKFLELATHTTYYYYYYYYYYHYY
nr:hypothetical protein BaRGS_009950 [Batillaria attramentaria]